MKDASSIPGSFWTRVAPLLLVAVSGACDPGDLGDEERMSRGASSGRGVAVSFSGNIAFEGTCQFLLQNSSWSRRCGAVLFTCDGECADASHYGCSDTNHWMAVPAGYFSYAQCGTCFEVCSSQTGLCTWGYLRDKSCCGAFEASKGIIDALGLGEGTFNGTVRTVDSAQCAYLSQFTTDALGRYPIAAGTVSAALVVPPAVVPAAPVAPPSTGNAAAALCQGSDSTGAVRNTSIIGSRICGQVDRASGDTLNKIWECTLQGWTKTTGICLASCSCAGAQELGSPGTSFTLKGCGGRVCSLEGHWVDCLSTGWGFQYGTCSR